jgi:hypothetical protein
MALCLNDIFSIILRKYSIMSGSRLFNLGLNQKRFGGDNKIATVSVKLGSTKGRGSSTRMFNWCVRNSPAPSLCIKSFTNFS